MKVKNIILLSGGSGKRLWPLSNEIRSKQFLKLFDNGGVRESMLLRIYRQIKNTNQDARITIATSKSQVSSILNQLGNAVSISIEPYRRDTFPAIALASAFLRDSGVDENEIVVVCPVDSYVDDSFFMVAEQMAQSIEDGYNLALLGIKPTGPSDKFGYIIPKSSLDVSDVLSFKEKPCVAVAKKYIEQGALWNGGVFAFRIKYILDISKNVFGTNDYKKLYNIYETLEKNSFDYAVVEKESKIAVLKYNGTWKDLGTWDSLAETMSECTIGDAKLVNCKNVNIINELDVPIIAVGLNDSIISASPDGILVSDKSMSSGIKDYVEERRVMFAEKSWGDFRIIDVEENGLTIKVNIKPGDSMNYHSHQHRDEVWVVINGNGRTIIDGVEKTITTGDVIIMKRGAKHTVYADSELTMIEVQVGKDIKADDKIKYHLVNHEQR